MDFIESDFTHYSEQCRINAGIDNSLKKGICSGDVLKISDVDTEIFINAVIDHNHTWYLGMQLEV